MKVGLCPPYFMERKMAKQSRQSVYEEKAEALLAPIAEANQVRIYDVEFVKEGQDYYLRCYIDKDTGVTIGDCENVSRALSDELDRVDLISEPYTLEVSSPGLGRTLTRDRHLSQSIGMQVEITGYKKLEAAGSKNAEGTLVSFDKESVTIADEEGKEMTLPRKEISVIRLALDF